MEKLRALLHEIVVRLSVPTDEVGQALHRLVDEVVDDLEGKAPAPDEPSSPTSDAEPAPATQGDDVAAT
ncbi:MAG TPA: hypothetical protein VEJ21_04210 [Acidimicrobiales bacterium]|nr:hypothetical protein [Acidimicrobiales bacterium]